MSKSALPTFTLPSIVEIKENSGAIFYDFDGVLTDNRVLVTEEGIEGVFCNRSDGLAISTFRNTYHLTQAIISTESNPVVAARAEKLKLPFIHKIDSMGTDKEAVLRSYATFHDINLESSLFIGNDLNDLPALKAVSYPCCPADSYAPVLNLVRDSIDKNGRGWISTVRGGYGVIRELLDVLDASDAS